MPDCFPQGGCSPDVEPVIPVAPNPHVPAPPELPDFFTSLPATGQDLALILVIAAVCVAVGYILVLLARRG